MTVTSLLAVEDLAVSFRVDGPPVRAVRAVTLHVGEGESLALVGESGCGKSVTALALLGLLPVNAVVSGRILWRGNDLNKLRGDARQSYRGRHLAMVFQEPATSLNPVYTAGEQVAEVLRYHRGLSRREAWDEAVALLREVQIPDADQKARSYPHQLSGGMRQRVMLAAALASQPELLVADEPTTALDVTVQSQILTLLDRLRCGRGMALIFITHNLALVPLLATRIAVMYAGRLVESGPAADVLAAPAHPYTRALVAMQPELWPLAGAFPQIPGRAPAVTESPVGCPFAPRCDLARSVCRQQPPPTLPCGEGRSVACLPGIAGSLANKKVLP
jgi:oligopeptide/dipeptide ABC transporter ATP-binding protein